MYHTLSKCSNLQMNLSSLLFRWQQEELLFSPLASGTIRDYMSAIRRMQAHPIMGQKINDISVHMLESFLSDLLQGFTDTADVFHPGYACGHLAHFTAPLKHAFHYACRLGWIPQNPMGFVRTPVPAQHTALFGNLVEVPRKLISHQDFCRIVDYLKKKNDPAALPVQIAYYTGLRLGEVCALTWEDIDLQHGSMQIRRSYVYNQVHRNFAELSSTKSKRSRMICFGPVLQGILQQIYDEQRTSTLQCSAAFKRNYYSTMLMDGREHYPLHVLPADEPIPDNYYPLHMVCQRRDGAYESPRTLGCTITRLRKKLPGLEHFSFHCLRHTYTSNLLLSGAPMNMVQEMLGHADISTTMNIYAHTTRQAKLDAAAAMEQMLVGMR